MPAWADLARKAEEVLATEVLKQLRSFSKEHVYTKLCEQLLGPDGNPGLFWQLLRLVDPKVRLSKGSLVCGAGTVPIRSLFVCSQHHHNYLLRPPL